MPSQEEMDAEQDGLFYILMMGGCLIFAMALICGPLACIGWYTLL